MKIHLGCIVVLAAAVCSTPTFAEQKAPVLPDLSRETPQAFQVQIDEVHAQMRQGGRFEYISHDAREEVDNKLAKMKTMIANAGTVAKMSEGDKVTLFNTQQRVNELLTHYDSERKICTRAQEPGSLFRITTCHTYAEMHRRNKDAENALQNLRQMQQPPQAGVNGGN